MIKVGMRYQLKNTLKRYKNQPLSYCILRLAYFCRSKFILTIYMQLNGVKEEQKRQDTVDRLQFILESAGIGTWEFYPKQDKVYWDNICRGLYGFSTDDVISYP